MPAMEVRFTGEVWSWRGPAPYHFVTVDERSCKALREEAPDVSYGWGMVPVRATVGGTTWKTSLFPKDGGYVLPVKDAVRRAEQVDLGDVLDVRLEVQEPTAARASAFRRL